MFSVQCVQCEYTNIHLRNIISIKIYFKISFLNLIFKFPYQEPQGRNYYSIKILSFTSIKYLVGQKVGSGFPPIRCYGKTQANFLANPIKRALELTWNLGFHNYGFPY